MTVRAGSDKSAFIVLFYKPLLFMTFDVEVAPIYGVNVGVVDASSLSPWRRRSWLRSMSSG